MLTAGAPLPSADEVAAAEITGAALGGERPTRLWQLLVTLDFLAAAVAWGTAAWLGGSHANGDHPSIPTRILAVAALAVTTVLICNARRLYRTQACSVRAVEMQRLGQVVLLVCAVAALAGRQLDLTPSSQDLLIGGLLSFVLTNTFRGTYRSWLSSARQRGRFLRQVVIVGANAEAGSLCDLIRAHPQLGLRIVGVIGDPTAGLAFNTPRLGPISRTEELVASTGATGVLLTASALSSDELNRVVRNLLRTGVHIHVSTGLRGVAHHRLRPQSFAHEPVLYLEPLKLGPWQRGVKRALDVVVGVIVLVLSLPIVALAALAIKLDDGGPVIFRQPRVGRDGMRFMMLKLRTMAPDAEARYEGLACSLAGRTGPLVKLSGDPRVTRVGRVLRATSIDELPQLINVVRGTMSLVGPRPNLLVEAEGRDPAFLAHKCQVRPGMSGLWQVEARDNPSFDVYKRLDIFYLENWSMSLDLAILLVTLQGVVSRGIRLLRRNAPDRWPEAGC